MDNIVDLFYHIKYMFTGDSVKADVDHVIRNLRPALQLRLRFITHLNVGSQGGSGVLSGSENSGGPGAGQGAGSNPSGSQQQQTSRTEPAVMMGP